MDMYIDNNNVYIENVTDFSLSQTLECGQCFHYVRIGEEDYKISAFGRLLHISQHKDTLIFHNTSADDYEHIWKQYFDLDRDYSAIKEYLLANDPSLKSAINQMWGIRLLNQDFFETLISFIISQNQQIPRIKRIIAEISGNYGKMLDEDIYTFPDAVTIIEAGDEGLKKCKTGFRAPYIIDACRKYINGELNQAMETKNYYECVEELKKIKGVGDKVANCVALFSLGHREAFPVDVWIKRIMEELYFGEERTVSDIAEFARGKYGEYGGYAQQYLFYYGKINEIGKKTRK